METYTEYLKDLLPIQQNEKDTLELQQQTTAPDDVEDGVTRNTTRGDEPG